MAFQWLNSLYVCPVYNDNFMTYILKPTAQSI